jgi:hypothetical protein
MHGLLAMSGVLITYGISVVMHSGSITFDLLTQMLGQLGVGFLKTS